VDPWVRALQGGEFASADRAELITMFTYLEFCLTQARGCPRALPGVGEGAWGGGARAAPCSLVRSRLASFARPLKPR